MDSVSICVSIHSTTPAPDTSMKKKCPCSLANVVVLGGTFCFLPLEKDDVPIWEGTWLKPGLCAIKLTEQQRNQNSSSTIHALKQCMNREQKIGGKIHGRVVKGVGHLDHVWSYGVREVVSSIPYQGNIVGWVFHPDQVTGHVFSSEHAFPSKFWIYLEHCSRAKQ